MKLSAFTEEVINNAYIRTFSSDVDSAELTWHRDKEDRLVEAIGTTNWKFQFDNELPKKIEGQIFIPKGVWHRTIKGDGDLVIKIIKL